MKWPILTALPLLSALACSAAPVAAEPDAATTCACTGSGISVVVDYGQAFCLVYDFSVKVTFAEGSVNRGDLRCQNPFLQSNGSRLELPWPDGVRDGEQGTVELDLLGDMDEAVGTAGLNAAPGTCVTVTVHAPCRSDFPDAAVPDAAPTRDAR